MKTTTTEVAENVYRISTFIPDAQFQFNQFLVKDDEPLLYHTGMNVLFPPVLGAVKEIIDPKTLKWIAFSHYEADECGSLDQWLGIAPEAQAACGAIGAMVSVNDVAARPARPLGDGETIETGRRRFRYVATPHLPHAWDAGHLFEETGSILFCSDLFHQMGDVEAVTKGDVVGRFSQTLQGMQEGPMAGYVPYGKHTVTGVERLAALEPCTLLPMHGSAYVGNGAQALADMGTMLRERLG